MDKGTVQAHRKRGKLRLIVVLIAATALFLGMAIYLRPLTVGRMVQQVLLRTKGIRSQYVQLEDYRIHYYVGGEGRPLVFVHGLGARSEDWADILGPFARSGFRVYAPDLLGYGRSDKPDVEYSIALEADLVRRFLDSQGLKQTDLAGWSMGGWICLKLASDTPHRVRNLILLDSAGMRFNPVYVSALRPKTLDQLTRLLQVLTPRPTQLPGFVARDILRMMIAQDWVIGRSLESMETGKDIMDGKLRNVTMPVLLAWGKEDVLTPLSIADAMKREMPQAELFVAEGACGHLAPVTCRDQMIPVMKAFLGRSKE